EVRVKNSSGEPIPQALVCLSSPENRMFYFRGRTNCFGYIAFEINPYSVENFDITVTAPNYLPYESRCHVLELPALSTNHHSWKTLLKKPDIPPDSRFYLFDTQGRLICAGTKSIISDSFEALSPGIYYLYLKKSGFNSVKKLIITR
ncbi:MAG: hypothetical protein NZ601_02520, partial [candidate division WOR-3 bacterium]|nr:hypothetical protein [candidate division WOR-3 bacterium]MDW7987424.1 hypothetical protein [candidate division WOR-3 bacterium]